VIAYAACCAPVPVGIEKITVTIVRRMRLIIAVTSKHTRGRWARILRRDDSAVKRKVRADLRSPHNDRNGGKTLVNIDLDALMDVQRSFLPGLIGMRYVEASKDRLVAELTIRDELRTVGGALHGGTIMAFADTVGATATFLNLPPGASTTTLESKTNFFAAGRDGVVRAEATPLHRGRSTMVWQTRVTDASGRLLAQTIQTQMVLAPR